MDLVRKINDYGSDILNDRIPACKLTKLSVERHFKDLDRQDTEGFPYHFDERAALRNILSFTMLKHYKGRWAGQEFELLPWQLWVSWCLYGWVDQYGKRRFRQAWIDCAKKSGKTSYVGGLCIYGLKHDGEEAPEIYAASNKKDQAMICFTETQGIARKSNLKLRVRERDILNPANSGKMCALASDADTLDGLNGHVVILDEVHASPNLKIFDNLISGMGAREQPLLIMITTAGFDRHREVYDHRRMCIDVLEGAKENERLYVMIYSLDEGDDISDERNWHKANPGLGKTVDLEFYRNQFELAQTSPNRKNNFEVKLLNTWTDTPNVWIDSEDWAKCDQGQVSDEELKDIPCYAGVDLAESNDLNALVIIWPTGEDEMIVKAWFWIPEKTARSYEDRVPYWKWKKQGYITFVQENAIEPANLAVQFHEIFQRYTLQGVGYDTWRFHNAFRKLKELGQYPEEDFFVGIGQGTKTMAQPIDELTRMVLNGKMNHQGNPILDWMRGHVELKIDTGGNAKFDKSKYANKIDGLTALATAWAMWQYREAKPLELLKDPGNLRFVS